MSTEEFIAELQERHKDDIEDIMELLEILKELPEEEKKIYEFSVTSNL
jgi:2-iminoacetate synthase ThiH